ncbi:MAG: 2OG-Fe(II) oxygenase family protein [Pseudomonadota bacterium]
MSAIPSIRFDRLQTAATQAELADACSRWGFFQLTHHGVNANEQQGLLAAMRAFFDLPLPRKRAIARTAANPWGFYDQELTKNTPDWKQIFDVGDPEPDGPLAGCEPQWPVELPAFRPAMDAHRAHCERLSKGLLVAIAESLGVAGDRLAAAFEPSHTSFLRLNYYPLCAAPEAPASIAVPMQGHLGINHHTDAGALTVLMQDSVNALQVFNDGRWHTIEPDPGAFVINIGDVVQVWSNDRYTAPLHRVLANAKQERYSAAYFYNPAAAAHYAPLRELGEPRYRPIAWGEFRTARAAGDYADSGEEIQIAHFAR